ncbi:hypothetical protein DAPPUDRAFT_274440 [Daphnia pulex]|uniref:Uncharacterized protein n=1 Tax=Daphnia pulex TaxID=6669 RepID=E9I489_DAPPU|nr:hypothetical protein DAPPUDRAFT_274440 [Daphnia pulex]|eukprot:EFX61191.1 hypothetical protein DAPPUDRAFT_274440 [Daphnia pulex]
MATPMNEASRMGITAHITRWINNIQQYENVPMDLTVYNLVLEAESNLRNVRNKFKRLTEAWWQRVTRDMKQATMTQAQFDAEVDNQTQVEEDAEERWRQIEEDLARMRDRIAHQQATQQAKEKAEEETNWQRSLSAKNDAHQKVITQRQIEEDLARMRDRIAHQQAMKQSQRATSTFPTVSNPEKGADDPAPIPPPDSKLRSVPALSPLERPATSLDVSQPFPNNSQLIKSSCTFQVLEDPVSTEIHQPPDSNQEKMASFSQSEGPATSLDSSANFLPPDSKPESKNLQFVWDPGGKATNRVSRFSLGPASETSLKPTTKRNDQQEDELTDNKRIRSQRNSCSSVFTLSDPAVLASLPTNQKMIQPTIQPSISNPMEWALVGNSWILKT